MPATKRGGRKRAPAPPPPPASTDEFDELPGTDGEPEERPATLDALLSSIAGDSERYAVHLYRKRAGRPEYIVKLSLEEFSLDNLRERFGGGDYEVRILRRDERNVERFYRTVSVVIAGAPKLDVQPATSLPPGGPIAVIPAPAPDRIDRLERMVAKLAKRLEQPTSASPLDMLEKVGAIVQSFRKGENGASGDVMQWLRLGLQLGAKQGGGQPDGFDKFLGELAGPFAALLTQPNGAPAGGPAMSAPPMMRTAPAAPAPGDPAAAKLTPVWLQLVAPYLGFVYQWAKSGDDPKQRAQVALAMIPAQQLESLATAAEAPDFVTSALAALPPAFQQPDVREWTTQFLAAIEGELTEVVPEHDGGENGQPA